MKYKIVYNAKHKKYAVKYRNWSTTIFWSFITQRPSGDISKSDLWSPYLVNCPLECDKLIDDFKKQFDPPDIKKDKWVDYIKP